MHRPAHRYEAPNRIDLVKASIARLETGWNHKNGYLWASAFTDPCQYIDAFGQFHHNWTHEQNAVLHNKAWATAFLESYARFLVSSLEFIDDKHCMVILHCTVSNRVDDQDKTTETHIMALLSHFGQEWLIRYFQNTPVRLR